MEGNFLFDIKDVIENIGDAEVTSVFLPNFHRSLIIDTRFNDEVGPFVKLMPIARSPQDRLRSIRRLRPQFPRPSNLTPIPWQRYVNSLVESGVWDRILDRVRESGDRDAVKTCEAALKELRRVERNELVAAITGQNHHTLWSRDGTPG